MRRRLFGWLGLAGFEAAARLAALTLGTAVFSRLLTPQDFGVSALALIVATVAGVFVGAPFEEPIAQRKVLRMIHLRNSMGAAMAVGIALAFLSLPLGWALARLYGQPQIAPLLALAMAANLFVGHSDVMTGLARRLRRFNDIAAASLAGNVLGTALAVLAAFLHFGIWALLLQRVFISVIKAATLQARLGYWVRPRWAGFELDGIGKYARISLADRLMDNLTFLAFNDVVAYLYGVETLGFVNMAMRFVEPIRGAFLATSHNLAFYFFASVQSDPPRLAGRATNALSHTTLAASPVFAGLAAVAPILLPLAAGPGWQAAIPIAVWLAAGSAIYLPARLVFTAISAAGRPQYALIANFSAMAATIGVLVAMAPFGPVGVGVSRVAGDVAQVAIATLTALPFLGWSRWRRFAPLARGWALSLAMALFVYALGGWLGGAPPWLALAVSVVAGVVVYGLLFALFARETLIALLAALPRSRR